MPRFAANLSMLFTEVPFIERFDRAARAGFGSVEFLFPYAHTPGEVAAKVRGNRLSVVLHNLPAGDWDAGERGIACLPDRVDEFRAGVAKAIEYATALGAPQNFVIKSVTWKAARAGIITGVLLSVARISGETAPLLFTALGNSGWNWNVAEGMNEPMASLPGVIYAFATGPYQDQHDLAWAGALLITTTVLALSILARILDNQKRT